MEERRPNLVEALRQMGDFYMELKWDFQSWGKLVYCNIHSILYHFIDDFLIFNCSTTCFKDTSFRHLQDTQKWRLNQNGHDSCRF